MCEQLDEGSGKGGDLMTEDMKQMKKQYWLVTILFFAVVILVACYTMFSYYAGIGGVFWIVVAALFYRSYIMKLMKTMSEKNDPYYYEECWKIMKYQQLHRQTHYYHMAKAKYDQQKFAEARVYIDQLKDKKIRSIPLRVFCYVLHADILFEEGNIAGLSALEEDYSAKYGRVPNEGFLLVCMHNNVYRAYVNKDYTSMLSFLNEEKYYMSSLRMASMGFTYSYLSGVIEKEIGNTELAKKHLQFVSEKGNKLYIAEKARKLLEEINGRL